MWVNPIYFALWLLSGLLMKCIKCLNNKHYRKFRVDSRTSKRRSTCIECENLAKRVKRASRLTPQQQYIYDYLLNHRCYHCGYKNPICLDFHHLDPKLKSFDISKMIKNYAPINEIEKEIKKCIVLCSNCHRIETARIQNNYKYRMFYK